MLYASEAVRCAFWETLGHNRLARRRRELPRRATETGDRVERSRDGVRVGTRRFKRSAQRAASERMREGYPPAGLRPCSGFDTAARSRSTPNLIARRATPITVIGVIGTIGIIAVCTGAPAVPACQCDACCMMISFRRRSESSLCSLGARKLDHPSFRKGGVPVDQVHRIMKSVIGLLLKRLRWWFVHMGGGRPRGSFQPSGLSQSRQSATTGIVETTNLKYKLQCHWVCRWTASASP